MTDRAKKISELQATTSVASTDKIVVLKDPAGTPSTRSVTANIFALSIASIARGDIPTSNLSTVNTTIASNGTTAVSYLSVANNKMYDVFLTARDVNTGDRTIGHIYVAANGTHVNAYVSVATTIGSNPIDITVTPTINTTANTTTLYFVRGSSSTANVEINYKLTKYT